jgi:hypothetical protein
VADTRLLESGGRRLLESGGYRLLESAIVAPRHFWRIIILDPNLHVVDIPQSDIESWSFKSSLNGGSGTGQLIFVRDFNKIGALGEGYTVMIWFWSEGQTMPTDPYYSGTIVDELDQEQLDARGRITVQLRGDATQLDRAIVTSTVTGGIGGTTPMPDAVTYISTLCSQYQPPSFLGANLPSSMFQLWPLQFDGTKLGACIDTVVKQSLDPSGHSFVWFVKTNRLGQRQVVVQLDQNPNVVPGATFSYQWPSITCDQYKIQNIYRNIINVVAIYGGKDPTTGQQVYQVAQDATSIGTAGRGAWEDKLSVPALISNAAALSYAQTWLAQNAYPTASGTARLLNPDPSVVPGRWVQFNEVPATSVSASVIKQVKIAEVDVQCDGQRIQQTLNTNSPIPYLDEAIYRLGQNVSAQGAIQNKPLPVNTQTLFVIAGGAVSLASSSPAKINITACTCVFASTGQISVAAVGPINVTDSTTSATGDGDYTVWANAAGTFTIAKGIPPAPSATSQLIAKISVVAGTPFVTDARTLMAQPALDTTQQLQVSGTPTFPTPPNAGAGAFDQPVNFTLVAPYGTRANAGLANLQLGWRATGSSVTIAPCGSEITPNATGVYSGVVPGIGAGTSVDIYVRGLDTHDLPTLLPSATQGWVYLGTVINQQADVQFIGASMDLSTGYLTISDTAIHPTKQSYTMPPGGVGSVVEASWASKTGVTNNDPNIYAMYDPVAQNGYKCYWSGTDQQVHIQKVTSGASTPLVASTLTVAHDTTKFHNLRFTLSLMASGSILLAAKLDGVLMCTTTDSSSPYTTGTIAAQFGGVATTNYIDSKTLEIVIGGAPGSSLIKSQGSIIPATIPGYVLTINSPTAGSHPGSRVFGTLISTMAYPDGSSQVYNPESLVTDSSGADGTWYYMVGIVIATNSAIFYLSQSAPTVAQTQPFLADGVVPVTTGQSIVVPAGSFATVTTASSIPKRYIG